MCAGLLLHERLLAPSRGSRVHCNHCRTHGRTKCDTDILTYRRADGGTYRCADRCTYSCAFGCSIGCTYRCTDRHTNKRAY